MTIARALSSGSGRGNERCQSGTHTMTTIRYYRGTAAQAARRGLMWRRIALRGEIKERVSRDTFEAANQFRLARYLTEDAK